MLLDAKQLSKLLKVTPRTIHRWRRPKENDKHSALKFREDATGSAMFNLSEVYLWMCTNRKNHEIEKVKNMVLYQEQSGAV